MASDRKTQMKVNGRKRKRSAAENVNQSLKRVMNRAENSTITNVSRKKRTPFTDVSNMQNKRTKRENNKQGELWPKDQSTTQSIGTSETSNTSNTSNDEPTRRITRSMKSNEEHEERFDDEYQNKNLIAQEDITSSEDDTNGQNMLILNQETHNNQTESPTLSSAESTQAGGSVGNFETQDESAEAQVVTHPVVNLDEESLTDIIFEPNYRRDIYAHLREHEHKYRPNPNYCESIQMEIIPRMRSILMDWLVEVAEEYSLQDLTLFIGVCITDRYLSLRSVSRSSLQLVGVTSLLIAAKMEEIYAPSIEEMVFITDSAYNKQEIFAMEADILSTLKFTMLVTTPRHFLSRYLDAAGVLNPRIRFFAKYLLEITILDYGFLAYAPSLIAASAVSLALRTTYRPGWGNDLEYYSEYREQDLFSSGCITRMWDLHRQMRTYELHAINNKYQKQARMFVSTINALPEFSFE